MHFLTITRFLLTVTLGVIIILIMQSYNLRSTEKRKTLKCYLQSLSESNLPQDFSPEVRLERLKILEVPEKENFCFYLKQDKIVRKQSGRSRKKKILLLICFTIILFSLFLLYWQCELQICGFIFYNKIKHFQNNIKHYYFANIDPYKNSIGKCVAIFMEKQVKQENKKCLKDNKYVEGFNKMEIKGLVRTYMEASKSGNITPKLPQCFIDEDLYKSKSKPTLFEESQSRKYKFYNATYFESGNLTDYALASRGAKITTIFDTEPYGIFTMQFLNYDFGPLLSNVLLESVNSFSKKGPASVLIPWQKPGDCWAFKGSHGRIQIQLSQKVMVTAVTIDHIPRNLSPHKNVLSAPNKFSVFGIVTSSAQTMRQFLGSYEYKVEGPPMQTFSVDLKTKTAINNIEFFIETNHGNKMYTCLYKIRVHGYT